MTTTASIKALTDPNNMKTRWTHRKIAYNALKGCELTVREVAKKVVKPYNAMQKRMDELEKEGMLIIVGEKLEKGQPNSIYKHNPNPPKASKKKPKIKMKELSCKLHDLHDDIFILGNLKTAKNDMLK